MEISKRQAKEIVKNLKSVIDEDINFIAPDGTIIASSDESRTGSYHEGAVKVAETKKPLIIRNDADYVGARRGINLPIFYEQNLIAIVGITGEAKDIIAFSNIIVKMSEILIKENFLNAQKQFKRENNRVIMELITKDKFNPEILEHKMDELSYDPGKYRYFLIAELSNFNRQNVELSNMIYNSIEKRISIDDILARSGSKFMLLSQVENYDRLIGSFSTIKAYVENKYRVRITVGVSERIKDINHFYRAYEQANTVVEFEMNRDSGKIEQFDGSSLDFLFQSLATSANMDFPRRVLKNLSEEEIAEVRDLILNYIAHNGSINAVSEALYIHKNTVQYRLNKIANLTGYNPRHIKDLVSLYIALELDRKKHLEKKT
ncbi:MAG: CdaR family transcriptional regulator [Acholeplasmataceae bacterium]